VHSCGVLDGASPSSKPVLALAGFASGLYSLLPAEGALPGEGAVAGEPAPGAAAPTRTVAAES